MTRQRGQVDPFRRHRRKVDEMTGRAREAWGDLTDDDKMKAEGMVDQLQGKAGQTWGEFKEEIDRRSE